jgi:hypothetical protein
MSNSAVASAVSDAAKTATKANAEAEKIAKENKKADVTTIHLALSKIAAENVLDNLPDDVPVCKAVMDEIESQLNG